MLTHLLFNIFLKASIFSAGTDIATVGRLRAMSFFLLINSNLECFFYI